ncbi:UDP-glycosyltransferase UGT5-like [Panulirus ornatus]|uniref:UDP-glycosyltransferase UGT5-like n=1 Tax=Panulirus ornatus TaxID=150431 RepID=UPI003A8656C4
MRWWSVAVVAVVMATAAEGARVLMLSPFLTKSHRVFFIAVAEALAARNHTVTYLTGLKATTKPSSNIHEVFVPNVNVFTNLSTNSLFNVDMVTVTHYFGPYMPKACADALSSQEMQRIQEEEFDVVVMSAFGAECFYPYIHSLQVPYIHMSANGMFGVYNYMAGNPHFSSLVINRLLDLEYPMTLVDRLFNTVIEIGGITWCTWDLYPRVEEECRKRHLWTEDAPSLTEMSLNGSLFIINSVQSLETPIVPYVPTVVHAGGLHCRPPQPLPQDLEEWVAGAGDSGFIFFSVGTVVNSSFIPEKHRNALLRVFASLEQRVLWKWDQDTMKDLPPNVRLARWLPQQDILGHPRLCLFISHGGLLSIQEATYHGVPLLGLPVYMDQYYNLRQVQRQGWGRVLRWEDLAFDTLRQNILDLIHDSRVRQKVLQRREVMRDQPMPMGRWVSYWVEYVIRHGGAPHLRSPALTMPWYQLYNVDVWLVVVVVVVLVVAVVALLTFKLLLALWSYLSSFRKRKQE